MYVRTFLSSLNSKYVFKKFIVVFVLLNFIGLCSQVVLLIQYFSEHVRSLYTGDNGILSVIQPDTLLIDSSTIDPAVSKEMAVLAEEKRSKYIDAPVSGGMKLSVL